MPCDMPCVGLAHGMASPSVNMQKARPWTHTAKQDSRRRMPSWKLLRVRLGPCAASLLSLRSSCQRMQAERLPV